MQQTNQFSKKKIQNRNTLRGKVNVSTESDSFHFATVAVGEEMDVYAPEAQKL